jgi:hypothetical protein
MERKGKERKSLDRLKSVSVRMSQRTSDVNLSPEKYKSERFNRMFQTVTDSSIWRMVKISELAIISWAAAINDCSNVWIARKAKSPTKLFGSQLADFTSPSKDAGIRTLTLRRIQKLSEVDIKKVEQSSSGKPPEAKECWTKS